MIMGMIHTEQRDVIRTGPWDMAPTVPWVNTGC